MFLYHITKKKHLKRIFSEGLLPGIKSRKVGMTTYNPNNWIASAKVCKKRRWDRIFLTDNIDYIIDKQAGKEWMKDAIILKINIKNIKIKKHQSIFKGLYDQPDVIIDHPHEYICYDKIDAKKLKIKK